ncbi:MAG: phospholipase [bacterium]|nr:phospholipase [bacterium]
MIIKNIEIKKTARYAMLGTPGPHIRQVWFICHGYGQLAADFIKDFEGLVNGRTLIVAPEALHRFYLHGGTGRVGASWMTKEERLTEIDDNNAYLEHLYREITERCPQNITTTVLGFSQGTATACRWALKSHASIRRIILWGGDFPADTPWEKHRERLSRFEIQLVGGDHDPLVQPEFMRRQAEMLEQKKVAVEIKIFDGTHEIKPEIVKELAEAYEKE